MPHDQLTNLIKGITRSAPPQVEIVNFGQRRRRQPAPNLMFSATTPRRPSGWKGPPRVFKLAVDGAAPHGDTSSAGQGPLHDPGAQPGGLRLMNKHQGLLTSHILNPGKMGLRA